MLKLNASWRTNLGGAGLLLVAVGRLLIALFDNDPTTVPDITSLVAAITGLGLLASRDNNITSSQAKAGPQ